jgi:hypothetical protein
LASIFISSKDLSEPAGRQTSISKPFHAKMQLVKIAIAIVAVAFTPSEGAEVHVDNRALLSEQVANLLRGAATATCSGIKGCQECCGPTDECCGEGTYCSGSPPACYVGRR